MAKKKQKVRDEALATQVANKYRNHAVVDYM